MFFPHKIKNVKASDKVLEIGPGADPHPRSDVLLEMKFSNDAEYEAQFGHSGKLITSKKIVYYNGFDFPFENNEFDYVICSHVVEHVEDPAKFISEIFRVAPKGYMEYPLVYYEYLYNFDVHKNLVKFDGEKLIYIKKSDLHLDEFLPIQQFFLETLKKGHAKLINDLLPLFMEGFEWNTTFPVVRSRKIADVAWKDYNIPLSSAPSENHGGMIHLIRKLYRKYF